MKHTRVVSTKCTPGFACRAFSDTTLVCFIVNEHTTKCSRYTNNNPGAANGIFCDNWVHTMAADALTPCITKPSATIVLTMQDKQVPVFCEGGFQTHASFQCYHNYRKCIQVHYVSSIKFSMTRDNMSHDIQVDIQVYDDHFIKTLADIRYRISQISHIAEQCYNDF